MGDPREGGILVSAAAAVLGLVAAAAAQQAIPFASRVLDTDGRPVQVLAADLDVDGDADLVHATDVGRVDVRWNLGGGSFSAPSQTLGSSRRSIRRSARAPTSTRSTGRAIRARWRTRA